MEHRSEAEATQLLRRRTEELKTLVRVAQLVNVVDLDSVLTQTLALTAKSVGADKGSLFLLDGEGKPVQRFLTQRDLPPEMTRQVARNVIEKGLAGWCIRHRLGAVSQDVAQDERWYVFPEDEQTDVASALCVPILYEEGIEGIITLVSAKIGHFDLQHLQLVTAVANQAGVAIRNARLFDNLQTQQRQLEMVLQNSGEALLTVDLQLRIQIVNHEAIQLLNIEGDSPVRGEPLANFAPQNPVIEEVHQKLLQNTRISSMTFEMRDEKRRRDYTVSLSALEALHGANTPGYVVAIRDITSIRDLSRLKTHMLHVLSHDLKNPINIIWGYMDLIRIDTDRSLPAEERFLDGVFRALHRMDKLIEETLSAERFLAAGMQIHFHTFAPQDAIEDAINALQEYVAEKHLQLRQELSLPMDDLVADRFQIREAMANLISNAIKYTPNGGIIKVSARTQDGRFYFSVEDNGVGIPQELQSQLFKKFYRALRPATKDIAGTGLGLSLVKQTIETYNGEVWFKSEEGIGSTFGFWLPLTPDRQPIPSPS